MPVECEHPPVAGAAVDRGEGVGERRRGQRRRLLGRARRAEAGLHPSRHRRLARSPRSSSSQRHPHVVHGARHAPTVPVTFDRPTRGRYGDRHLVDAPAGVGGAQHHLERPAEAAVARPRARAASVRRATRIGPEVVGAPRRCGGAPSAPSDTVRDAQVPRPCTRPGSGCRAPSTRSACAGEHGRRDPVEVGAVERAVAVHERDEVLGGGDETGVTRSAEATSRFDDDDAHRVGGRCRPSRRWSRCRRRSAIQPSGMPASTAGDGPRLVERREDHVAHVRIYGAQRVPGCVPDDAFRMTR